MQCLDEVLPSEGPRSREHLEQHGADGRADLFALGDWTRFRAVLRGRGSNPCLPASSSLTSDPCYMAAVVSIGRCPEIHAKRAKSAADSLPIVNAVGLTTSTTLAN